MIDYLHGFGLDVELQLCYKEGLLQSKGGGRELLDRSGSFVQDVHISKSHFECPQSRQKQLGARAHCNLVESRSPAWKEVKRSR